MSTKKRHSPTQEGDSSSEPKRVKAPELDTYFYTDCNSPVFDTNRVLLRRVFFIDPEKLNISLWDFILLEIINP